MDTKQRRIIESKLKNCPFCGAPARLEPNSRGYINGKTTRVAYVRCSKCNCRTEKFDVQGERFTPAEARQLAMNAWEIRWEDK